MSIIKFLKGISNNLPKKRDKNTFYITEDDGKIILDNNVWDSKINAPSNLELITENKIDRLNLNTLPNNNTIFSYPKVRYSIQYNVKGATLSNNIKLVDYNSNFSATITPNFLNYTIIRCDIYVGGILMTEKCYDNINNTITINNIKGNVYILLICEEKNKEHKYITVDNFIKDYGNNISLRQEDDYVVINIKNGSTFFYVTSNSYFPEATNCKLQLDDLIVLDSNGNKTNLPNYVGFWNANGGFLQAQKYDIKNGMNPSIDNGSNGRVSFGTSFFYGLFVGKPITIKMKAKLIYT